jgi:hypothetical protein
MYDLNVNTAPSFDKDKYHIGLSLVEFIEDGVTIIYSPSLDLSGYGYDPDEARTSFDASLKEFFRFTKENGNLYNVLKGLGWSIQGSKENPFYFISHDPFNQTNGGEKT